ncbi:hypothetical protein TIFTF001_026260 [Ficus carica]|uniref:Uncharacterized protein n=1 Tax=Ficus carica TaxID=3494 RepID=A0AA88IT57_FICCA|nr:hypothetical protein TIFTF001_026260 [Ficus carica]
MRKSSASKLDYFYEINYVPDEQKIISEDLPIINPYHAFVKQSNPMLRTIKQFVRPTSRMVREYVQSTKFSQYNLPATTQEQFVSLEIPPEYPAQWQTQGFTHLHFGAVRLALTFHGRKGLPVAARIALLDSRHRRYRDAVITIVQTTLNAETHSKSKYN